MCCSTGTWCLPSARARSRPCRRRMGRCSKASRSRSKWCPSSPSPRAPAAASSLASAERATPASTFVAYRIVVFIISTVMDKLLIGVSLLSLRSGTCILRGITAALLLLLRSRLSRLRRLQRRHVSQLQPQVLLRRQRSQISQRASCAATLRVATVPSAPSVDLRTSVTTPLLLLHRRPSTDKR